jgi:hypothetical protein
MPKKTCPDCGAKANLALRTCPCGKKFLKVKAPKKAIKKDHKPTGRLPGSGMPTKTCPACNKKNQIRAGTCKVRPFHRNFRPVLKMWFAVWTRFQGEESRAALGERSCAWERSRSTQDKVDQSSVSGEEPPPAGHSSWTKIRSRYWWGLKLALQEQGVRVWVPRVHSCPKLITHYVLTVYHQLQLFSEWYQETCGRACAYVCACALLAPLPLPLLYL